jgi:hypothetical protein
LVYPILLVAGLVGLAAMALLGFVHMPGGHGGHGGAHHHALDVNITHGQTTTTVNSLQVHVGAHSHTAPLQPGHGQAPAPLQQGQAPAHAGHVAVQGHGHGQAHGHAHGHAHAHADGHAAEAEQATAGSWLMPLVSPLNWFSWSIGAGATGTACHAASLPEPWTAAAAVAGAALFHLGFFKPVWGALAQFASQPAGNLEGCLMQNVEAVTSFNERGEGLVRVVIDGRSEDVLARLSEKERAAGLRVHRGDRLMIEEVDPRTNSCRVCRG